MRPTESNTIYVGPINISDVKNLNYDQNKKSNIQHHEKGRRAKSSKN